MTDWIYESPDNGKTILRRRAVSDDDIGRSMLVEHQAWWNLKDLQSISRELILEQKLRDEHPALNELWEQYQTMKNLLRKD